MIQPRNTIVVVRLIEKASEKVGKIEVPTVNDQYCEAEIMAVGPGTCMAGGAKSETFDLVVGQRVWLRYQQVDPRSGSKKPEGVRYIDSGEILWMFEQSSILGILAQPGQSQPSTPVDPGASASRVGPGILVPGRSLQI